MTLVDKKTVNVYEHKLTATFEIDGKSTQGSYYISDAELKGGTPSDSSGTGTSTENPDTGTNYSIGAAAVPIFGRSGK